MGDTGRVVKNQDRTRKIVEPESVIEIRKNENITATIYNPPGIDSKPLPGDFGATINNENVGGKSAIGFLDTKNSPMAGDGEIRIISRSSSGAIQTIFYLKADGNIVASGQTIEVLGNTDFAVSFNELAVILSKLATDINTNLTAIQASLNSLSPPVPYVPAPIVIDLTPAKIEKVKFPSP